MQGSSGMMQGSSGMMRGSSSMMQGSSGMMRGSSGRMPGSSGMMHGSSGMMQGSSGRTHVSSCMTQGSSGMMKGSSSMMPGSSGMMKGSSGMTHGSSGMTHGSSDMTQGSSGMMSGITQGSSNRMQGSSNMMQGSLSGMQRYGNMMRGSSNQIAGGGGMAQKSAFSRPSFGNFEHGSGGEDAWSQMNQSGMMRQTSQHHSMMNDGMQKSGQMLDNGMMNSLGQMYPKKHMMTSSHGRLNIYNQNSNDMGHLMKGGPGQHLTQTQHSSRHNPGMMGSHQHHHSSAMNSGKMPMNFGEQQHTMNDMTSITMTGEDRIHGGAMNRRCPQHKSCHPHQMADNSNNNNRNLLNPGWNGWNGSGGMRSRSFSPTGRTRRSMKNRYPMGRRQMPVSSGYHQYEQIITSDPNENVIDNWHRNPIDNFGVMYDPKSP